MLDVPTSSSQAWAAAGALPKCKVAAKASPLMQRGQVLCETGIKFKKIW